MADKDMNKAATTDECRVCTGRKILIGSAVAFLILATTLSMCMVVVFIQNNKMLNRMEELEAMISTCNCQANKEETTRDILQSLMNSPLRNKRRILNPISDDHNHSSDDVSKRQKEDGLRETEHIKNEHHGISSNNIALLYGDADGIYRAINGSEVSPMVRLNESSSVYPTCNKVMENGYGGRLCIPHFPSSMPLKFMIRSDPPYYRYFTKAPWMNGENFEISDHAVIVKKSGLYIVTSNIHFVEVSTGIVHYGVFVRNESNAINSERILGLCATTVSSAYDGYFYSCSTWQLALLKRGDRVFMRINQMGWFRVQKETFFLALIKLNDFQL